MLTLLNGTKLLRFLLSIIVAGMFAGCGLMSGNLSDLDNQTNIAADRDLKRSSEGMYHFMVGELALKNDDVKKAIKNFTIANDLQLVPSSRLSQRLAALEYQSGNLDTALVEAEKAIDRNPDDYKSWVLRGGILEGMKDYDGAIINYNKASIIAPNAAEPVVMKASLLYRTSQQQEARKLLDKFTAEYPDAPSALVMLARMQEENMELDPAEKNFRRAWKISTGDMSVGLDLVRVLLKLSAADKEKKNEAKIVMRQIVGIYPKNILARRSYAQILYNENNLEGAISQLKIALKNANLSTDEAVDLEYELSLIKIKQGKIQESIAGLEKILGTKPKRTDIRFTLANLYASQGQYKNALDQTYKISVENLEYTRSEVLKALLLHEQGKSDEAIEIIKKLKKFIRKNKSSSVTEDYLIQLESLIKNEVKNS